MKLTKEYLATLSIEERKSAILKEYFKCKVGSLYCIETYFTVKFRSKRIPFKLFPHQLDTLDSYERYTRNLTLKTRQMGLSVFTAVYIARFMVMNNNKIIKIISKSMIDSQKFLKEIRDMLDDARKNFPWLIPEYDEQNNNKRSFSLKTGSTVIAESTTEDAGRGDTLDLLVVDEAASIDRKSPEKMAEIWSAAGVALTNSKGKAIIISTPRGTSGWYYDQYTNAEDIGWHVIDAHWIKHPEYSKGTYQWIINENEESGGHLFFHNEAWPEEIFDKKLNTYAPIDKKTYPFICDGRVRSPWYDNESRALGPLRTACELDCSFSGTGGEVFDADILRQMTLYAKTQTYTNPFESLKGIWKNYREYKAPIEGHRYILSADVATGDGSDFSGFTVIDITALEIVATYKDQILTTTYAVPIQKVGKRYFNAMAIVENAGGGETTLQELKRKNYPNIFYSTLNKKDPSTGIKKRKIGLWPSENVRFQGGDRLEEVIRLKQLLIPDEYLTTEFFTWIWDKDGKRRHAPEKNDDIIMALQHGIWYYFYVYQRSEKNRNNFKQTFEVKRNGQTVSMLENDNGQGQMVSDDTRYTIMPGSANSISGNIDSMIDARIMSNQELAARRDRVVFAKEGGSSNRRKFI